MLIRIHRASTLGLREGGHSFTVVDLYKDNFNPVLASGFAFEYEGLVPKGLLEGKSAWVFYTIDSPLWYVRLWRRSAEWVTVGNAQHEPPYTGRFLNQLVVMRFIQYCRDSRSKRHLDSSPDPYPLLC